MYNFQFDKRILYIVLAIMVIMSLSGITKDYLMGLLLTLPGVIIAITFHEFAHAYAAYKLGDDTPKMQGRLNLNPLSHLDPIGSILLIFAHVGWGKPVQINPRNFDKKHSMSTGEAIVSIAGPTMNFILAILISIIYGAIIKFIPSIMFSQIGAIFIVVLKYAIIVNIGLGVFNLIPLPPLDGSKIFRNFMSYNVKQWLDRYEYIFYIVFLVLWISGLAGEIISPIIGFIAEGLMNLVKMIFGIYI